MNRAELQQLSRLRVREAAALLRSKHYAGCYYLLGYAVECAIKSAIAKGVRRYDFPDKKLALDAFEHDLAKLMKTAGLYVRLVDDMKTAPSLEVNWAVVKDWTVDRRYQLSTTETLARDMYSACTARSNGVLSWLRNHW